MLPVILAVVCVALGVFAAWFLRKRKPRQVRPTRTRRIAVVGQAGAGKTALIHEVAPDGKSVIYGKTEFVVVEGADAECDGFVFVLDATQKSDPRSAWMEAVDVMRGKPTLVFANKADVAGARRYPEIEAQLGIEDLLLDGEEPGAKWPIKLVVGAVHAKFGFRSGLKWLADAM